MWLCQFFFFETVAISNVCTRRWVCVQRYKYCFLLSRTQNCFSSETWSDEKKRKRKTLKMKVLHSPTFHFLNLQFGQFIFYLKLGTNSDSRLSRGDNTTIAFKQVHQSSPRLIASPCPVLSLHPRHANDAILLRVPGPHRVPLPRGRPRRTGAALAPGGAEGCFRLRRRGGVLCSRGRAGAAGVAEPGGRGAWHAVGGRGQGQARRHTRAAFRRRRPVPGVSLSPSRTLFAA